MNAQHPLALALETASEAATLTLAEALGHALAPGDVVGLAGDLGAGKTVFVRGMARGAGVDPTVPVCSPTFTLVNVYPRETSAEAGAKGDELPVPFYHFDLYRLDDEDELEAIGYRDYVDGSGLVAIEWCDQVDGALPDDHLRVTLAVRGPERRSLEVVATGPRARRLRDVLRAAARGREDVAVLEEPGDAETDGADPDGADTA